MTFAITKLQRERERAYCLHRIWQLTHVTPNSKAIRRVYDENRILKVQFDSKLNGGSKI